MAKWLPPRIKKQVGTLRTPPQGEKFRREACFFVEGTGKHASSILAPRREKFRRYGHPADQLPLRLGRGPIEPGTAKLVDWHEPFVPLRRKVLDLLEIQDRRFTLADDCCPLAFLGQQRHRAQYGRAQFHRAVICQGDELFGVKGHGSTPTLPAGPQASTRAPNAQLSR
jgi:hypothetical protein